MAWELLVPLVMNEPLGEIWPGDVDSVVVRSWQFALTVLVQSYRFPLDQAEDLRQDFLLSILEVITSGRVRFEESSWKSYLRTCLRNFLRSRHRWRTAEKRGGHARRISLDDMEGQESIGASMGQAPDEALDREVRASILALALERVRVTFAAEGRDLDYTLLESAHNLGVENSGGTTYGTMAKQMGLSEVWFNNHLRQARRRVREAITQVIKESVEDEEALQGELELFRIG
jgi:DNA-directed RNA polymerase specialized sigma24 family protein